MSKVPSLPYTEIVKALERAGLSVEEFNELL
jgi:predicted RNA binding protein YcfA (HicA-like mRNA interferase family)